MKPYGLIPLKRRVKPMKKLMFKVEKMYRFPDAGSLKAFVDVSINDALVIRGVRIVEGKKGCFISMPSEQGKDSKWYDQVVFKSAAIFDELTSVVLGEYQKKQKEDRHG
jgi:stage V sporulation protein G